MGEYIGQGGLISAAGANSAHLEMPSNSTVIGGGKGVRGGWGLGEMREG